jgi:hypothetical protein
MRLIAEEYVIPIRSAMAAIWVISEYFIPKRDFYSHSACGLRHDFAANGTVLNLAQITG